jgi:hypothetical protein
MAGVIRPTSDSPNTRQGGAAAHPAGAAAVGQDKEASRPIEPPVARPESKACFAFGEAAFREGVSLRGFSEPAPETTPPEIEAASTGFAMLRARWRRGHSKDNTPKVTAIQLAAYRRARALATQAAIHAGAEPWIAVYKPDPNHLPELSGWLAAESWREPPPKKAKPAPGERKPSRRRGRPSMIEVSERQAPYYAARDLGVL